ncbi:MAG: hypothetical protein G01um101448_370 [Parcubacteria group bacterium Gr01-1014_48]|nr:MAG: hypothetical protein Greene041614_238 [Parcubacteria group bacterium Greene0416_14]TSC74067.1 MAG: hypothetical protein G01um101448_370 [Parcubacteria group bacterium Gr01-1014_48]TSD01145.1 MAG: hypothetical protein Greene101415_448 [Parcubacteria group bacterium Greene1014_15]TSD08221.1 MAG: hypothetical protein Greene07144_291 [Parcubacteria group bacterium Greene0714_4]
MSSFPAYADLAASSEITKYVLDTLKTNYGKFPDGFINDAIQQWDHATSKEKVAFLRFELSLKESYAQIIASGLFANLASDVQYLLLAALWKNNNKETYAL